MSDGMLVVARKKEDFFFPAPTITAAEALHDDVADGCNMIMESLCSYGGGGCNIRKHRVGTSGRGDCNCGLDMDILRV